MYIILLHSARVVFQSFVIQCAVSQQNHSLPQNQSNIWPGKAIHFHTLFSLFPLSVCWMTNEVIQIGLLYVNITSTSFLTTVNTIPASNLWKNTNFPFVFFSSFYLLDATTTKNKKQKQGKTKDTFFVMDFL